nr:hypothetical protein Itr_chr11CG20770 [Ipomoea trifida]
MSTKTTAIALTDIPLHNIIIHIYTHTYNLNHSISLLLTKQNQASVSGKTHVNVSFHYSPL